jgi:radical SAM protein with 4Fe4S-binding SPASM domain
MDITTTLETLKLTIGNPASRRIIKTFSSYCNKCNKNRIEVAIELYTGIRKSACLKCNLAGKVIGGILNTGSKAFGLNKREIKQIFEDPRWRKSLSNVLNGIANFGIQQPLIPGAPFLVVWDITYACNLKCKHCYSNSGKPLDDELTTNQIIKIIDKIDRASIPAIAFSGGEPLIKKDFFKITKYASDKGIYVGIATNGTMISKEKAIEMKNSGIEFVQISLDGASPKTHDSFRGIDGIFEKTINGINNCVNENFFVNIATTMTKYNYEEIPEIIDLCKNLHVNWFMAYNFIPTGRGEYILNNDLNPNEREIILKKLWNKLKTISDINILTTAPQFSRVALQLDYNKDKKIIPTHFYNSMLSNKLINLAEFIGGCGCGRFYCAIRPNGNIDPCVFFPYNVGNIISDNFDDLWKNNLILKELRNKDIIKGNCGKCDYRYYCGGCRARAYSYTNDYLQSDPGCINNIDLWKKINKIIYL